MSKEKQEQRPAYAVGIDKLPGELYQAVLYTIKDGKTVVERPYKPHVWGHVKYELELLLTEKIFPPGLE